jgi:nucleoid-associated protein YgaU
MALYKTTSRYELTANGKYAYRKPQASVTYYLYTSREGDTFDIIASRFFNDPERYWEIADINPQVEWPDQIPVGTIIRIPQL